MVTPEAVLARLGHHAVPAVVVTATAALAADATGAGWDDWVPVAAAYAWTVGVVVHASRPCVPCAGRVVADGPGRAVAWGRWLRSWHVLVARPMLVCAGYLAVLVALPFAPVPAAALILYVYAAPVVWVVAMRRHGMVRPWCPQCRDDGGGGWSAVPVEPPPGRQIPA